MSRFRTISKYSSALQLNSMVSSSMLGVIIEGCSIDQISWRGNFVSCDDFKRDSEYRSISPATLSQVSVSKVWDTCYWHIFSHSFSRKPEWPWGCQTITRWRAVHELKIFDRYGQNESIPCWFDREEKHFSAKAFSGLRRMDACSIDNGSVWLHCHANKSRRLE